MSKQIVVVGSSGVGKTYALKKAFGVDCRYGVKSAIDKNAYKIGKWSYLPELTGNVKNRHYEEIKKFFEDNDVIVDAHPKFLNVLREFLTDVEFIQLVASEETIRENINRRGGTKGSNDKDKKVADSVALQNSLDYDVKLSQKHLIGFLKDKIERNE